MVLARHGSVVLPLLRKCLRRERDTTALSQLKDDIDELEARHDSDTEKTGGVEGAERATH